jgi:hypothetical protein
MSTPQPPPPPLLAYAVSTIPDPLQASPSDGDPSLATLIVDVSNKTSGMIECTSISFNFIAGTGAKDLFPNATGIGTTVPDGWQIQPEGSGFKATPLTPAKGRVTSQGLTFTLSNIKVNQQTGTADMTITEVRGPHGDIGKLIVPLAKFPYRFEVGDLTVDKPNVKQGESVTLHWNGSSGATYELQYDDAEGNTVTISHPKGDSLHALPANGSYTVENLQPVANEKTETVFTMLVTMEGSGDDHPPSMQRQVTVTVAPAKPQIKLFQGEIKFTSGAPVLVLKWNTDNAEYCELTGNSNRLKASSTDGSYTIDLKEPEDLSRTYELTARNNAGASAKSSLKLNLRPTLIKSIPLPGAAGVAVSRDGSKLYVNIKVTPSDDPNMQVLDAHTLTTLKKDYSLFANLNAVGGRRLYFIYDRNPAGLGAYDENLGPKERNDTLPDHALGMAVAPDGTRLYITGANRNLCVANSQTLQVTQQRTLDYEARGIAVSRSGDLIYVAHGVSSDHGENAAISILDADTLDSIRTVSPDPPISGSSLRRFGEAAATGPANTVLVSTSDELDPLLILDSQTLQPIAGPFWDWVKGMTNFAVSRDFQYLYASSADGKISVFSMLSVTGGTPSTPVNVTPVKINSFTVDGHLTAPNSYEFYPKGNVASPQVNLKCDVTGARRLLLDNGEIVEGTSVVKPISGPTKFKLYAYGEGGKDTLEITVTPKTRALQVSPSDKIVNVSFDAARGTYQLLIKATYFGLHQNHEGETRTEITSHGGRETYAVDMGPFYDAIITSAEVTVTGFPEGPITARYSRG